MNWDEYCKKPSHIDPKEVDEWFKWLANPGANMQDLEGKIVSEEEVAKELGFKDVFELRQWNTEKGREIGELKHKLSIIQSDADNFRWQGMRMAVALRKIEPILEKLKDQDPAIDELLLGLRVALNKEVDWDKKVKHWWTEIEEKLRK